MGTTRTGRRGSRLLTALLPAPVLLLLGWLGGAAALQAQVAPAPEVDRWVQEHQHALVDRFVEFLSIPNVAADLPNVRRNADWLVERMESLGIRTRVIDWGQSPFVYGERTVPGAELTLLLYSHYDGQPVDPARWADHGPWEPILREGSLDDGAAVRPFPDPDTPYDPDWRIYARSASDAKGGVLGILTALEALDGIGVEPSVNLKFLFEGDEEAGSPQMARLFREHRELMEADAAIIVDGPIHQSGLPTVFYGLRGISSLEITVYGPQRPLHSGHYGNWAPNPAMRLAHLLASMKDDETGRVLVEGFYDDVVPLSELEREAIAEIPQDDEGLARSLGFAEPEAEGALLELINQPSLNVRGMRSAWVGEEARTIVPDAAVADLDLRLVRDVHPEAQVERVVEHIRRQGYHVVEEEPDPQTRARHPRLARVRVREGFGYPAMRTSMDLPVSRAVADAVARITGEQVVRLPTLGGSAPLFHFTDSLDMPTMGVPIVNFDNNQHSPNENLRIGNLFDGIRILAGLMTMQ